jgi:surfeit locus 1 family protein
VSGLNGLSGWRFWVITLAAVAGVLVAARLGTWQWGRAEEKLALEESIRTRAQAPVVDGGTLVAHAGDAELLHRTVRLRGQWLGEHTVYLDNRQMQGRPGFYVVTPLRLAEQPEAVVLVQRGWVPRNFSERERLPEVPTPSGEVSVAGRIGPAPSKLYEFDGKGGGPIRQNLDLSAFRQETGLPLIEGSVQQTGPAPDGLLRDWPQPASGAGKNFGYAFQWWAIGGLILVLYVWFQFFAPRRRHISHD